MKALFLSAAIWALEGGMLLVLAQQLDQETRSVLISLLTMTLSPQTAAGSLMPIASLYALVCLGTLLLAWPLATALYLMRLQFPRRGLPTQRRPASAQRGRRLHLRVAGKTL